MALRDLGVNFEYWKISDWEVNATTAYKAVHHPDNNTDYSKELNKDQLVEALYGLSISTDGKKPLEIKQIARKNEKWLRTTYNNFKASHNLGSIINIHAKDLEIEGGDNRRNEYVLTYSFP